MLDFSHKEGGEGIPIPYQRPPHRQDQADALEPHDPTEFPELATRLYSDLEPEERDTLKAEATDTEPDRSKHAGLIGSLLVNRHLLRGGPLPGYLASIATLGIQLRAQSEGPKLPRQHPPDV